ncbi:MAG: hypothetical protein KL785_04965 [Brevundimonas sp.]|nr:hypothetical protein [Brevundimonas sp.]
MRTCACRDGTFLTGVERWFAERAGAPPSPKPPPPMFAPLRLRGLTVPNRVVVSPMCMYSAEDGTVNDFHLVHLGGRALGGAGLVFTEMTDVSADARITPGCAGMYRPEHRERLEADCGFRPRPGFAHRPSSWPTPGARARSNGRGGRAPTNPCWTAAGS